ncbi:MAG: acylphosphatase [Candidatus Dactylopiibacterium sp.]|nr:acylphosphatase [Candidatus Dactylopiibacterium sp.]
MHTATGSAIEGRLLRIRGGVQGVGFRWHLVEAATARDLQGWVRNRHDGSVEALVWGDAAQVAELIHWAGYGPPHARVSAVEVALATERPQGFVRLPDA